MTAPKEATTPDMLRLSVAAVLEADKEFRANMPPEWEGDPLSDEIDGLRRVFSSTLPIAGEGKVKQLEWSSVGSSHKGDGAIVCYYVDLFGGEFTLSYPPMRGKRQESYGTLDAAKVAAQTDYEALILSALISSPGKDGGQEVEEPCPTCGNEERGQGGYLSCECPAPRPASTALVERLAKALEPFAEEAACYDPDEGDGGELIWATPVTLTIGHLREARAALSASQSTSREGESR